MKPTIKLTHNQNSYREFECDQRIYSAERIGDTWVVYSVAQRIGSTKRLEEISGLIAEWKLRRRYNTILPFLLCAAFAAGVVVGYLASLNP
jgi:hypothetical protein